MPGLEDFIFGFRILSFDSSPGYINDSQAVMHVVYAPPSECVRSMTLQVRLLTKKSEPLYVSGHSLRWRDR